MTSNERKILKYLSDAKGHAHIKVVSRNVGFTTDYTRLICRSLVRTGYLTSVDASVCVLSIKGRNCFPGGRETEHKEQVKKSVNEAGKQRQTIVKKINSRKKNPPKAGPPPFGLSSGRKLAEKKKKFQHCRPTPSAAGLDEFKDATPQEKRN